MFFLPSNAMHYDITNKCDRAPSPMDGCVHSRRGPAQVARTGPGSSRGDGGM